MLRLAKLRYRFATYSAFQEEGPLVLWRHDVDMSMHRALRLAEIEAEEGVTATYFVLLHSDFYNLLEPAVFERLRRIRDLGHAVGLHFDASFYPGLCTLEELAEKLRLERAFLEALLEVDVRCFSYHHPEVGDLLRFDQDIIGGMINTYGRTFRKDYGYCSDSNGYWRFRRLKEVLEAAAETRLQVLTHPAWWQEHPMSPYDRVERCIEGRAGRLREAYAHRLHEHGRKNVS